MGCWNGTCGLSNLPILSGEKVVLFVLKHQKHAETNSGGFCYPWDQWFPISMPIYGEYNDYGGVENFTGPHEMAFTHLMSDNINFKIDEEELNHNRLNGKPANLDELINDYIERGVYKDIGFMMVRQDVFDTLLENIKHLRLQYRKGAELFVSKYEQEIKQLKEELEEKYPDVFKDEKRKLDFPYSLHHFNEGAGNIFIEAVSSSADGWYLMKSLVMEVAKSNNLELADAIIDLISMQIMLLRLRKHWTIQTGKGSQSEEFEMHNVLAKKVISITEDMKRRYLEHEEEDY